MARRIIEVFSCADVLSRLAGSSGAGLVTFVDAGVGAVVRSVLDKLREWVSVKDYGAVGDGLTDDRASINTTMSSGAQYLLFPPGTYLINSNITLTLPVMLAPGAKLRPAAGVTVTISGPITADDYQIFDEAAAGSFVLSGRNRLLRAAWWGMSPSATAAANTTAFNEAVASVSGSTDPATILLPAGTLNVNSLSIGVGSKYVQGAPDAATWLVNNTTDKPAIEFNGNGGTLFHVGVRDLRIAQASSVTAVAGNCGVRIKDVDQAFLDRIEVINSPGALYDGFRFEGANDVHLSKLYASNCLNNGFHMILTAVGSVDGAATDLFSYSNDAVGFYFSGCSGVFINNLHAYGNGTLGIHFASAVGTNQFFFGNAWVADTSGNHNWYIENLNRSSFSACWAASQISPAVNTTANGFYLVGGADVYDVSFMGCKALSNNGQGVYVTANVEDVQFVGCEFMANGQGGSGAGLRIEAALHVTVVGCRAHDNATFGIVTTAAASNYLVIQGCDTVGNTSTGLSHGSTGANNKVFGNVTDTGYGANGTVTQSASKTTGVTLNTRVGQITTNNANLATGAEASFVVTNNTIKATDVIAVNHASGGTAGAYQITVSAVAANSFTITISNASGGDLAEALVINFKCIEG